VDKDSGLIHSVVNTAANVHDITSAAELLHGFQKTRLRSMLKSRCRVNALAAVSINLSHTAVCFVVRNLGSSVPTEVENSPTRAIFRLQESEIRPISLKSTPRLFILNKLQLMVHFWDSFPRGALA